MKKITLLSTLYFLLLTALQGQTPPNAFNYSAVARNAAGQPIAQKTIGIQITILKTATTGVSQYVENHFVNTDQYGLFNLIVGAGAVQSGSMSAINWSNDNYYLKVGMDANGGTNFLTMGTTQLLSVPYALYAKTAGNSVNTNDSDTSASNELQTLSIKNDTLFLTNGGFVKLPSATGIGGIVAPTVTTTVSEISSNFATLKGSISNATASQIYERGFVISTSPNPSFQLGNSFIVSMGNGIGNFDTILPPYATSSGGEITLTPNTTYFVRAYARTENDILFYGNQVSFTSLPVGQTGPGGGIVFFDKGNNNAGWRYLEVAPGDQSSGIVFGCSSTSIAGTKETLGSGKSNTTLIVAGCNDPIFPAKLCDNLVLGGQNDWFLPSILELYLINKNLHVIGLGNFSASNFYWSSTELPDAPLYIGGIIFGNVINSVSARLKNQLGFVRAIRAY